MNNQDEIVYIEIDHWCAGRDYPDCEPVLSWMGNETYDDLEDTPESRYVGCEECFLPYIDENIGTLQDGKDWY